MKQALLSITAFALLALLISLLVFAATNIEGELVVIIGVLTFTGMVGSGSFILMTSTNKKIHEMKTNLTRIEALQEEIQKEIGEQKEKSSSQSTVVASLQALSQTYIDYLARQEAGDAESTEK